MEVLKPARGRTATDVGARLQRGLRRLALYAVLSVPAMAAAQAAVSREYQLKAVFLYNFAQFVEWPAAAFTSEDAPLAICVLGADPFGAALAEAVKGEAVGGRPLVARHVQDVAEVDGCQMLFISRSESGQVGAILAQLQPRPILTVSEIDGFAGQGGSINFYLEQNKVRFEINPDAAQQLGIRLNAQLLSLGRIVAAQ